MQVYARSNDDITSAFVEIDRFIKNHITSKKVENDRLYDVVLKHWDELERLAKDDYLKIKCVAETTVSIEGLLSKVLEAKDKLSEWIKQYDEEERRSQQLSYVSKNVQWYYSDLSSREVAYSAQLNGTIEVARMNGKITVEITESGGQQYHVDFTQMVARNKSTGQTRKLSRKLIGSAAGLYHVAQGVNYSKSYYGLTNIHLSRSIKMMGIIFLKLLSLERLVHIGLNFYVLNL